MVANGLHSAQVLRYRTEVSSSTSSAPIIRESGSAAKYMTLPMNTDVRKIMIHLPYRYMGNSFQTSQPTLCEGRWVSNANPEGFQSCILY